MWSPTVINFYWKCYFRSSSRKTIVYKRFHYLVLSITIPKSATAFKQFSNFWHIDNNNQQSSFFQNKIHQKFEIAACLQLLKNWAKSLKNTCERTTLFLVQLLVSSLQLYFQRYFSRKLPRFYKYLFSRTSPNDCFQKLTETRSTKIVKA